MNAANNHLQGAMMKEYNFSQVVEKLNISENTLRNYLKVFHEFFSFKRGEFNRIIFSEEDVEKIAKIYHHNRIENISTKYIKRMLADKTDKSAKKGIQDYFEKKFETLIRGVEELNERIQMQERILMTLMSNYSYIEEKISFVKTENRADIIEYQGN
jgi:DNA-binding transcriptional MerR regulator